MLLRLNTEVENIFGVFLALLPVPRLYWWHNPYFPERAMFKETGFS